MIRAALLGLVGVFLLSSCLSPTQVTIELSTDTCSKHPTTTIAVGDPGKAETATPQTTTTTCDEKTGSIGTIVVTPSSDNGATFEVQVVVSVGVDPSSCKSGKTVDKGGGTGCLVARREIAFVPHSPLKLPIEIDSICLGHECPKGTTCITKDGKPTCEKDVTGCSGDDPNCNLTSGASAGVGGSGGSGGSGMGGSSGTGGAECTTTDCNGCADTCAAIAPGSPYKSCPTPVLKGAVTGCADSAACCPHPCSSNEACVLSCGGGAAGFQCVANQWKDPGKCARETIAVQAGFLGAQVNLCVDASDCKDCMGACLPTRHSCCPSDFKFTCVSPKQSCCDDNDCGAENACISTARGFACQSCAVAIPGHNGNDSESK